MTTPYNYPSFIPEYFQPWMRFDQSPFVGERGPDFPLWRLDGSETTLHGVAREHQWTIVEFGSFT